MRTVSTPRKKPYLDAVPLSVKVEPPGWGLL